MIIMTSAQARWVSSGSMKLFLCRVNKHGKMQLKRVPHVTLLHKTWPMVYTGKYYKWRLVSLTMNPDTGLL